LLYFKFKEPDMKMPSSWGLAIAVVLSFVISNCSRAAPLLSVDFGRNIGNDPGTPSPVQSGFNGMAGNFPLGPNAPPPSLSSTFGIYTVTVSGDPYLGSDYSRVGFENTGAAASGIDPSIRSLFEDAMINNLDLNNGAGLNLSIKGVIPNTQYILKLWSYNAENTFYPTPTSFGPLTGSNTTGTSGSVTQFATPLPTSLDDYSTTIQVTSTTDTLDIHAASTANYGGTRMNGFELNAVPEPAAMVAAFVGLLGVLVGRRFTR
jgi:hypothetical protein